MTVLSGSISPQMGGAIRVPIDNNTPIPTRKSQHRKSDGQSVMATQSQIAGIKFHEHAQTCH